MKKYDEGIPAGHAFAETRDLKPQGKTLRDRGFKIEHRPAGKEATWSRDGHSYGHQAALELAFLELEAK